MFRFLLIGIVAAFLVGSGLAMLGVHGLLGGVLSGGAGLVIALVVSGLMSKK